MISGGRGSKWFLDQEAHKSDLVTVTRLVSMGLKHSLVTLTVILTQSKWACKAQPYGKKIKLYINTCLGIKSGEALFLCMIF